MTAALPAIIQGNENAPAKCDLPGAWPNGGKSVDITQPTAPGTKGPYRTKHGEDAYLERVAARMCPRPPCRCGCGTPVNWFAGRGRWFRYAKGHYRKNLPYKDEAWLREQYVTQGRSSGDIAREFDVRDTTILTFLRKFGIPRRDGSAAHIGLQVGDKNPAWKGGVAEWDYAPGWKVIARQIRDRDKWTCQDCGEQRKRWGHHLHVHHIDGDKLNNDPANLISLCALCHRQAHREGVMP